MKMLITHRELGLKSSRDRIPYECSVCHKTFFVPKHYAVMGPHPSRRATYDFCSNRCASSDKSLRHSVVVNCTQCNKELNRTKSSIRGNIFCSQSCAAMYNNTHKTKGYRRSKLERWIEEQLAEKYPTLPVDYNKTDAINAELDIYIPSLRMAFELNGIFHYEPIYGNNKLQRTQTNDCRKFQACLERQIELCVIDTSSLTYFKEDKAKKFLSIITEIVDKKSLPTWRRG